MKNLNRLLVLVSMLFSASVWAQLTEHINLIYNATDKALYLEQDFECEPGKSTAMVSLGVSVSGTCIESIAEGTESDKTPNAIIASLLKKYWKKEKIDESKSESSTLKLASDIKFGQTLNTSDAEWSCSENSQALEFSGLVFDGNDFQISQVCNVAYAGAWNAEMGLFHRISGGTVKNLKLSDVDFIILNIPSKGTSISDDEKDYYPVGGLAGIIENGSVVDHISLGYINVSAPFAGGLAGYVDNSAISNISMIGSVASTSKIIVTNDIVLTGNKKDSKMGGYKTLLGGLAGAAYSSEFNDIDVNIDKIECEKGTSQIESSALGGIAGLFVYAEYGKPARNMEITNIVVSNAGIEKVEIKGGSTMGGLFGETRRINSTPSSEPNLSDLVINNVAVKKLEMENSAVSSSSGTPNVYMGGLIGNSGLCNGGVLKIANSVTTEFLISEDITIPGTYQYYVGGIAGYAGCENTSNAGNRNDQYLTLRNSHASGEIWIKGGYSAKKAGDFFVSASVGGLVGTAMLASEKPLTSDTSSVNILYEAKSTPASSTAPDVPSVTIGGIVGAASLYNTSGIPLELEHIIARGISSGSTSSNVSVFDDGFSASVGGIIGEFPHIDNSGNSSISFADVTASGLSGSLLTYGGTGNGSVMTQTFMGGICGKCKAVRSLQRIAVNGMIFKRSGGVSSGFLGKEFYVGGLVGRTELTSWPIYVENTYSKGNISDFGDMSGYLFGLLANATKANEFVANYHYGEDNVAAIGKITGSAERTNVIALSTLPSDMISVDQVNVRNDNKGSVKSASGGVKTDDYMTDIHLAFINELNNAWPDDKSENRIWVLSDQTDHNAIFSDLYAVYFMDLDYHVYETKWTKKGGSVSIPSNPPEATEDGLCFAQWTTKSGDDLTNVDHNIIVEPETKICQYPVTFKFREKDGSAKSEMHVVEHGSSSDEPVFVKKTDDGWCFDNWDRDFTNIVGELVVSAQYSKCKYTVKFVGVDGKTTLKQGPVSHGDAAIPPTTVLPSGGKCFTGWNQDFSNVTGNMTIIAESKTCEYQVTFHYFAADGKTYVDKEQKVLHGEDAVAPDDISKKYEGRCFVGWDIDFTNVTGKLDVTAQYLKCEYPVTFHYFAADGKTYVDKEQKVVHGENAIEPDDISKKYEGRCFVGWDIDFTNVTGELNVTAQYLKCEYPVTFHYLDVDGNTFIDKEQKVLHGDKAIVPNDMLTKIDDKCFTGWDNDFTNVTGKLDVIANYSKCEYLVTFIGINGNPIKSENIVHGGSATPPDEVLPFNGMCFVAWKNEKGRDYTNVTENMNVFPESKTCTYEVAFYDMDGALIETLLTEDGVLLDNPQIVEYGKAAVTPRGAPRTEDGRCFDYWDEDYSNVKGNIHVSAISKTCEYTVTFVYDGADGLKKEKAEVVKHGYSATAPDKVPEKVDGQCFVDWKGDFTSVTGPMTIEAEYKTCTYTVTFVDDEGLMLKEEHDVEHGKSASIPDNIEPKDGKCHVGWETEDGNDFTHVTNDMTVKAIYGDCKTSSSSVAPASSSDGVVKSSSSTATNKSSSSKSKSSSSNVKATSSGSTVKSSTSKSKSSSSTSYLYEIAQPTVQQDGQALRMEFESASAKSTDKVNYHIQVVSDAGVYLDTVVDGKFVDKVKNGTWRLDPAPAGEYSVNFTLTDGLDSVSYEKVFSTPKEKSLKTNSWQTLSMYALCYNKGEECRYELEERIASEDGSWAVEECEHMKQEIAHGMAPDDEWFRENMEEVCRSAYASQGATTSVYWWDESNPVGEFWQYRKFSSKDKFDSTRGYWYGPMYNEPLELNLQTPDMAAEIVWKLYNRHSGWNLMANPYGWYVKLPQREDVVFWHWDSETGGYEHPEVLGPYEAVWVYAPSTMTLRIPLRASIVLENENKGLAKSASDENWNLRVVLSDNNGKRDAWNELAAGRSEKSLSEPPAGMGDHVDLSIVEGKQRLAKSVKKNGDDLEWNLEASATTSRRGHLSFVGLERVWAKGLRVYATIGDETIEVVDDKSIDVQLSSKAKNVSVHVTKGGVPAKIAKNWLSGFRVNQMSNALNVGFDAAAKLAGANVKVSIVGVDGRIVATSKSIASAGSNVVSMKKPKQGVYFVRAQVGSLSATSRIMVR